METATPNLEGAREDEARRLHVLRSIGILDTPPERDLDEIVELAASICEVPISFVSFVDADRQWLKAKTGLDLTESSRESSFCSHAIRSNDMMIVRDTTMDERFATNPLVVGKPGVRFYAGMPLSTEDGSRLGTLCVIDVVPRELTATQQNTLRVLAKQVMLLIRLRMKVMSLDATILENNRVSADLRRSDSRLRAFMEALPAAAFIKDEAGRMMFCNTAMTNRFEALPEQWIGKKDAEIWPPERAEKIRARDLELLRTGQPIRFDSELAGPNQQDSRWDISLFPFSDVDGQRFIAAFGVDVTKERQAEQALQRSQQQLRDVNLKLHKLSFTDGLTRIRNRRGLEDSLQREFDRARRTESPLSLLMLDVDHFKEFNDAYGHIAGDQVLQRIAVLMKQNTRKYDLVARYGGEEFVALLPDTLEQEAQAIATRLCLSVSADNWKHRCITVSVGVGSLQPHIVTPAAFIDSVDHALYEAKHQGRNQVRLVSSAPPYAEKATA